MRYLLDTCVISDFIKGEAGTKVRLKQTPPIDITVSAITVMELHYGLALNSQRAQKVEPAIASMITANQREFDRVPGLQTENWRQLQKTG